MQAVASGIVAHETELKKLMAEKDAILAERDDIIGKLEAVIASSARPNEINKLKSRLSLVKAEKELERRKACHFWLQVAAANATKQTLQYQVQSNSEVIKRLQSLLGIARNSGETTLAQERTAVDQNLKVQKADTFRARFEEGSRPPNERSIKSPIEYEEQIGFITTSIAL